MKMYLTMHLELKLYFFRKRFVIFSSLESRENGVKPITNNGKIGTCHLGSPQKGTAKRIKRNNKTNSAF
jgi:hypothetical protein